MTSKDRCAHGVPAAYKQTCAACTTQTVSARRQATNFIKQMEAFILPEWRATVIDCVEELITQERGRGLVAPAATEAAKYRRALEKIRDNCSCDTPEVCYDVAVKALGGE